jgi:enterochelin esterase-like enzyme
MKLRVIILFAVFLNTFYLLGQKNNVLKNHIFKSEILKEDVTYNVYLPDNYEVSKKYPVIYYLHWFGADCNFSESFIEIVDSIIKTKDFPDVIIIAPSGKNSWYIDDYAGKFKYSSMFINEFLPYIKTKYAITEDVKKTAIIGASMGGFGALRFSMLYPQEFGICVSFMAGISTKEQIIADSETDYLTYHQKLYGENLKPNQRANRHFIANNPVYIAENSNNVQLKRTKWYIQSCDNDYHSLGNAALHKIFHEKGVLHEFRVNNGEHNEDCIKNSTNDALKFIKDSLEKAQ